MKAMAKSEPPVTLFEVGVISYPSAAPAQGNSSEVATQAHLAFTRTRPHALCGRPIVAGDPGRQLGLADVDRAATCPACIAMLDGWLTKGVRFIP
jgi:hypothetical protein